MTPIIGSMRAQEAQGGLSRMHLRPVHHSPDVLGAPYVDTITLRYGVLPVGDQRYFGTLSVPGPHQLALVRRLSLHVVQDGPQSGMHVQLLLWIRVLWIRLQLRHTGVPRQDPFVQQGY